MVGAREVFGEVVAVVFGAWCPEDFELALSDTISDPVEAHVDGFAALLFYCVDYYTRGCAVVGFYRDSRLRVV